MGDKITFGHYRVLQRDDGSLWELGSGAMGVTYKALDTDLQCPVALKVINSDLMADEVNRNRFLREARAAAGLRHSNIASVYHLGKDEEQFFYAMEFIEGQTTEAYVARSGPMSLRAALRIAWQVSKALVAAARQQLVHRDIKPANIMIVADSEEEDWPFVKLIDFGLVRSVLRSHDSASATRLGLSRHRTVCESGADRGERGGRKVGYILSWLHPLVSPHGRSAIYRARWPAFSRSTSAASRHGKSLGRFRKEFVACSGGCCRKSLRNARPDAVELRREIEQCVDDIERRQALTARMALPLNIGRQWLTATAVAWCGDLWRLRDQCDARFWV